MQLLSDPSDGWDGDAKREMLALQSVIVTPASFTASIDGLHDGVFCSFDVVLGADDDDGVVAFAHSDVRLRFVADSGDVGTFGTDDAREDGSVRDGQEADVAQTFGLLDGRLEAGFGLVDGFFVSST